MGTDNLHHKRKAKTEREQQRRLAKRKPYDRVLIVCEGEKTEPNYFQELCDHYRLSTANVTVSGNSGSSPASVCQHAVTLYKQSQKQRNAYGKVFCVFDQDGRSRNEYQDVVDKIARQKPNNTFVAITSVPCFEYWLLLHFEFTTRPYAACGNNSVADQLIKALKTHLPDYQKSANNIFQHLLPKLDTAKQNAKKSLETAGRDGTDNPSTRVHELVDYLQNLQK